MVDSILPRTKLENNPIQPAIGGRVKVAVCPRLLAAEGNLRLHAIRRPMLEMWLF